MWQYKAKKINQNRLLTATNRSHLPRSINYYFEKTSRRKCVQVPARYWWLFSTCCWLPASSCKLFSFYFLLFSFPWTSKVTGDWWRGSVLVNKVLEPYDLRINHHRTRFRYSKVPWVPYRSRIFYCVITCCWHLLPGAGTACGASRIHQLIRSVLYEWHMTCSTHTVRWLWFWWFPWGFLFYTSALGTIIWINFKGYVIIHQRD